MIKVDNLDNEQLTELVKNTDGHLSDYSSFYYYLQLSDEYRRDIFINLYKGLNIDFKGKSVLDIGPGMGESLDIAKEFGAIELKFIDRDVILGKYCQNKGYKWINLDYVPLIVNNDINTGKLADILVTKGSFNFDYAQNEPRFKVSVLIDWLEIISDTQIFIPTWDRGELTQGVYHTCTGERFEKYINSHVHREFIERGYKECFIDGCNDKLSFPITYFKSNGG